MSKTHLAFALFAGSSLFYFLDIEQKIIFLSVVFFASIFPDIDTPYSRIGRRIRPLSNLFKVLFKHRGFLHTVFFLAAIDFLLLYFEYGFFAFAFSVGFLSHLVMDSLTKQGVKPFYPFPFRVKGFLKTGGFFENILAFLFLAGFILNLYMHFFHFN